MSLCENPIKDKIKKAKPVSSTINQLKLMLFSRGLRMVLYPMKHGHDTDTGHDTWTLVMSKL